MYINIIHTAWYSYGSLGNTHTIDVNNRYKTNLRKSQADSSIVGPYDPKDRLFTAPSTFIIF